MEGDGGHPSLMGFLGSVDIKITQSEDLGLSLRQKTTNVIIEGKFGETVDVEGIFRLRDLGKTVDSIAVDRSTGCIKERNFPVHREMQQGFRVFVIVVHHETTIGFGGIRAGALMKNHFRFRQRGEFFQQKFFIEVIGIT